jgi:uncharacterized protein YjbI with pentapeptide repeats
VPDFANAHIPKVNLIRADLNHANLRGTALIRADLSYSNLSGANLNGTYLNGTYLSRFYPSDGDTETQAQLDQACGTDVKLDPGLTLKPCPQ